MPDQRIQYTEELVGAGHPTKADTLNRLVLVEHNPDGTHDGAAAQSFRVERSTAQSISANTATKVIFDVAVFNNGTLWDGTNSRLVAPASGVYLVTASLSLIAAGDNSGRQKRLFLYKNGTSVYSVRADDIGGYSNGPSAAVLMSLNSNDYIEVYALFSNTGTIEATCFSAARLV